MRAENIKPLDKESQSPYKASRGAIVYKLYKNNYNNKIITSYDNVAQNLYSYYYPKYDKVVLGLPGTSGVCPSHVIETCQNNFGVTGYPGICPLCGVGAKTTLQNKQRRMLDDDQPNTWCKTEVGQVEVKAKAVQELRTDDDEQKTRV